jgi:hypothetical protein
VLPSPLRLPHAAFRRAIWKRSRLVTGRCCHVTSLPSLQYAPLTSQFQRTADTLLRAASADPRPSAPAPNRPAPSDALDSDTAYRLLLHAKARVWRVDWWVGGGGGGGWGGGVFGGCVCHCTLTSTFNRLRSCPHTCSSSATGDFCCVFCRIISSHSYALPLSSNAAQVQYLLSHFGFSSRDACPEQRFSPQSSWPTFCIFPQHCSGQMVSTRHGPVVLQHVCTCLQKLLHRSWHVLRCHARAAAPASPTGHKPSRRSPHRVSRFFLAEVPQVSHTLQVIFSHFAQSRAALLLLRCSRVSSRRGAGDAAP